MEESGKSTLRLPAFLREKIKSKLTGEVTELKKLLRKYKLHTVCESANCPNLGKCFTNGTATFMILGNKCTRDCRFCNIENGIPDKVDKSEPLHVAQLSKELKLKHIVITSVTRDDLKDRGAEQFIETVLEILKLNPDSTVEILVPDFSGKKFLLKSFPDLPISVFNHNIETIKRLYPIARSQADYKRSLNLLKYISQKRKRPYFIKSGFMVGLGETREEIVDLMKDLKGAGVEILTIGQYLRPSLNHLRVMRYYSEKDFIKLKQIGLDLGFKAVVSGSFVRSSYQAGKILRSLNGSGEEND